MNRFLFSGLKLAGRKLRLPLLCSALIALHSPQASAALAGGTYSINPAGTASATVYRSLRAAISDMTSGTRSDGGTPNGTGISGAVIFELAPGYDDSLETFPLTITSITGAGSSNTITIRPATGVSSMLSLSTNGSHTISLSGANYIVFDGRPGGVGTNKYLDISTTNINGSALIFVNRASNNVVRYCTIRGVNSSTSSGNVLLSASYTGSGNDNNLIDNCDFESSVAGTLPMNAIYSLGSGSFPNSNNTVSNCNITDFLGSGILLSASGGSDSWTITGNSIYQKDAIVATTALYTNGINIHAGGNHIITNNFIGGSQPRCGGAPWTLTGNYTHSVRGILVGSFATTAIIQNNTITKYNVTTTQTGTGISSAFSGIIISSGNMEIKSNVVGCDTGNNVILVNNTSTTGTANVLGIADFSSGNVDISGNIIGSITATANTLTQGINIYSVYFSQASGKINRVSGNSIGSTVTPKSIHAASAVTGGQNIYGIAVINGSAGAIQYTENNIIANLHNNSVALGGRGKVFGIEDGLAPTSIYGNTIFNLSSAANNALGGYNSVLIGIWCHPSVSQANVLLNKVHSLRATHPTAGANVTGIQLQGTSGFADRNMVHSLSAAGTNSPVLTGISISGGFSLSNSMIRMGLDADGNSANGIVFGIHATTGNNSFYHNSVYVGGNGVSGDYSAALHTQSTGNLTIQNNIFLNARNASVADNNYALRFGNSLPSVNTINYNLLYATGTNGYVVRLGATNYTTLASWQTASSKDANSISADPLFVNATGRADSVDLHLQFGTPAEKVIPAITSVTTDYDGESRASFGNMHIGADASHFSGVVWNGNTSSTWSAGGNWDGGVAPTATENAYIPAGASTYPDITTGTIDIASLLVNNGGRVKMSGGTLRVAGIINNKDTIDAKGGTIVLKDTFRRDIAAGLLHVGNLEIDDTAGVEIKNGTVNVYGAYTPTNGILKTNGNLVLKSDANGTARIASGLSGGNYILGDVTVERHIPGKRVFRFLAHPFSHDISMSELTDDIDITGSGGAPFTPTGTNASSAFTYDAALGNNSTTGVNPGWVPFTASSLWNRHQAMRVLVRGAKGEGLSGNSYTPSAATIDMTGVPNQGDITIPLTKGANTDFIMVGNPFPSEVNMDAVARTNVGSAFMVWNANQGVNGGYTSYSYGTSGFALPSFGSFFTTLSADGAMVFEETDKSSAGGSPIFKGTATNHMLELSLGDSTTFWDRLLVHFDSNAMATVDYPDAVKLYNPDMTFYTISKDDSMLAIDARPFTDKEVIKLGLYSTINKNFKITVPNYSTPAGTKVYLKDNYLNKTQEITGVGYTYWFATSADKKSWGNDRFELFTEVLPVGITTTAVASSLKVKLAPNPATNDVNIYCEGMNGKTATVSIVNMMGVQVAAGSTSTGHLNVPMQQLPAGMYMVTIQCDGQTITQKLIKK